MYQIAYCHDGRTEYYQNGRKFQSSKYAYALIKQLNNSLGDKYNSQNNYYTIVNA